MQVVINFHPFSLIHESGFGLFTVTCIYLSVQMYGGLSKKADVSCLLLTLLSNLYIRNIRQAVGTLIQGRNVQYPMHLKWHNSEL